MPKNKRPLRPLNYIKAVVMCHGKSEYRMVRYIKSNLHICAEPYAKDKGEHSIQITSIMNHLNRYPFDTMKNFLKEYDELKFEISGKGSKKKLQNFKFFIIMDTDDCTQGEKEDYINRNMFKNHWLYDYIVPVYFIDKLESVLPKAGISREIKDSEKGSYYEDIFPINKGDVTAGTIDEIKLFKEKVETQKNFTNLHQMVEYFLNLAENKKCL